MNTAPEDNGVGHHPPGEVDVVRNADALDVGIDQGQRFAAVAGDLDAAGGEADVSDLSERHLGTIRGDHRQARQRLRVFAEGAFVAQGDGEAFTAVDDLAQRGTADGAFDHQVEIIGVEPIAGCHRAFDGDLAEEPAVMPLCHHTAGVGGGARIARQRLLDGDRGGFQPLGVATVQGDAQGAADAGGEHLGTGLDRHPPQIGHARVAQLGVHLGQETIPGQTGAPERARLEHHHRLRHVQRCGIGGGRGRTHLAEDRGHLGEAAQLMVHALQDAQGSSGRDTRGAGWHVEDGAFVEWRHEFALQHGDHRQRRGERQECPGDHLLRPAHRQARHR